MKDYIRLWNEQLLRRPQESIPARIEVTGERDKHLGPKIEYAAVTVILEPSHEFEVVDDVEGSENLQKLGFPDWFVFGLLDVLMTSRPLLLTKVKVTLKDAKYDRIDTSPRAFLEAGRDAGQKALAALSSP